jgi:oligogalacturonide transporter
MRIELRVSRSENMKKKSNLLRKLAFASADIFGGGSFNIINFLYPGFLAFAVHINPFWSAFIILFARVFDAIIDPIIGWLSDRTKSRFGKRRIYLIVCSPLIVAAMFLLFYPFGFSNDVLRIISVLLSYLIFVVVQSSIMIPYFSLASEISKDYQSRASFNSYRLGFSIFSSIICVAIPSLIVGAFGDDPIGYQVMSLSFGVFFGISILLSGLFAKEEIQSPVIKTKLSFKTMLEPLSLKPFRQYLLMYLFTQIAMAVMSGIFFFYINFYIVKDLTLNETPNNVGLIAAALMFFTQIVALPFYLKMIELKSKAFTYRIGAVIWILSALGLFLVPANVDPWVIYVFAVVMGFGISAPGLIPHAIFGDVADAGQIKFKKRVEGQMSGFANFINQIAQALGLAFVMVILGWAGFTESKLGGPAVLSQPDSALLALRIIMAITPLLLIGLGMIVSWRYKIDAKEQHRMQEVISEISAEQVQTESNS